MSIKKIVGMALATTAASMIAIAPISMANTHNSDGKHACYGVNSCKGKGVKGKNECAGKGFEMMTKSDCEAKKGKWGPDMKKEAKAHRKATQGQNAASTSSNGATSNAANPAMNGSSSSTGTTGTTSGQ